MDQPRYLFDKELIKIQVKHDIKLLLLQAVKLRVTNLPSVIYGGETTTSVAVMFSGGLDSTLLVALLAEVLSGSLSQKVCIDLVSVSFNPETAADRITGIYSYFELKK